MPDELVIHLIAVLRESLSNVSRHAKASNVDVVVAVGDGRVGLSVADDGIGVTLAPAAGHGLENMTARADALGGHCTVTGRHPSGTLVQWDVPLHRD